MSEGSTETGTSTTDGNNTSGTTSTAGDEFKPVTSQEDLNKIIDERLRRERAKFSDYKDVKAKAAKLDEIEQANQSEVEKANSRVTAAEQERDQARSEVLRYRVAAKHGISDEDTDLFLTGSDEETLTKQAERLAGRSEERTKQGNRVPTEGTSPSVAVDQKRAFLRDLNDGG